MTVTSIDDPFTGDNKYFQYIHVHADDLPLRKCRVKIDLPWPKHTSKDILVPGNRFKIRDGTVYNNSKSTPLYATFKIGDQGVQIMTTHEDYTPYNSDSDFSDSDSNVHQTSSFSSNSDNLSSSDP